MERNLYLYFTKNDTVMDLRADIKWIHEEIDKVDDPTFLEAIKNMLKYRSKVSPGRISIEQYNKEIEDAERDIEQGNFYTTDEVRKMAAQWGRK